MPRPATNTFCGNVNGYDRRSEAPFPPLPPSTYKSPVGKFTPSCCQPVLSCSQSIVPLTVVGPVQRQKPGWR